MELKTLIDAPSLRAALGDRSLVVLDCRFDLAAPQAGARAYLAGHIPTARYVDLNRDLSAPVSPTSGRHPLPEPERLAARFKELGIDASSQVVLYDELNGSFAARGWWLLRWLGHAQAAVLDGGLQAWRAAGGAIEAGGAFESSGTPPAMDPRAERAPPRVDARAVVSSAELVDLLELRRGLLVDARAAERFAGTVEPIDPVAGHVPGAVNHPFSANLREDGRFLPPAELERRWRERLAGVAPADAIAMCGSGVTACHNLLALEIAGLTGARLYAGSWSEWIRDPERPVARG
ncbi:MAG TPA: sulfurtransferase [Steroidobacteraceae bacterium]|jgi:thiosulfate/3-mercaptopyruvate sulfurtransferase|nr:sulfurtransferase [Steroidobacteraceae bacterium]